MRLRDENPHDFQIGPIRMYETTNAGMHPRKGERFGDTREVFTRTTLEDRSDFFSILSIMLEVAGTGLAMASTRSLVRRHSGLLR